MAVEFDGGMVRSDRAEADRHAWRSAALVWIALTTATPVLAADTVTGRGAVLTTDTLMIGKTAIRLTGIQGSDSLGLSAGMELFISGKTLRCAADGGRGRYRCLLPDGGDLAETVLKNGAGRCDEHCPPAYRQAERRAKEQRLGIWRD